MLCFPFSGFAKVATWTGDPWDSMTRAEMVEIANEMIDTTWTPRRTIHNYRSPSRPRTTFEEGVTYRGVAYNMVYEADDWEGFLGKVNNTSGGETDYGNDCSAFISIAWRLPRRLNTVRFENEVTGPAELAHSLGSIGSGASVELIQGDVLNHSGSHNIMVDRYSNNGVISMEQTPGPRTTSLPHPEMRRNWSWSSLGNYRPIRRNLIDEVELPPAFRDGEWARTTASSLNFRSGPGTSHNAIDQLPNGTVVRILPHDGNGIRVGTNNWWYVEVAADGQVGWVAEHFIEKTYAPATGDWADIVVDSLDQGFEASSAWRKGEPVVNQYGSEYVYRSTEAVSDPAVWSADLPYAGHYRVYAWWGRAENPARNAPYLVRHAHGETTVHRDQRVDGGQWNELGTFVFGGDEARVRLSCWTGSGDVVIADAVRFVALDKRPDHVHTYDRWKLVAFSAEEREQPALTAPENDPFGRGVTNLAAYAFGMDPGDADRSLLPRIERNDDTVFVFQRLRDDSDLAYEVEVSGNLASWVGLEPAEGDVEVIDEGHPLTETIRVVLPSDDAPGNRFVRLKLERTGE